MNAREAGDGSALRERLSEGAFGLARFADARLTLARYEALVRRHELTIDDGLLPDLATAARRCGNYSASMEYLAGFALDDPAFQPLCTSFRRLAGESEASPAAVGMHAAPFLLIDDYLPRHIAEALLDEAIAREAEFEMATGSRSERFDADRRVTEVLPSKLWKSDELRTRVADDSIGWADALGVDRFDVERLEMKFSHHGDGGFFLLHRDAGVRRDVTERTLSYMIYLRREPEAHTGGDFLLFDTNPMTGERDLDRYTRVEPRHNRLVVVRSESVHAVCPVVQTSNDFADGRFAVTGHLCRLWDASAELRFTSTSADHVALESDSAADL